MTFYVGQKVECVNDYNGGQDDWVFGAGYDYGLRVGVIYTIVGITDFNNLILRGIEGGWNPKRFRPIVEKQTDISFAHEILRKVARKNRRKNRVSA